MNFNSIIEMVKEYLWVVGLGLIVGGISKLNFEGGSILISGLIISAIGVIMPTTLEEKN